MSSAKHGYHGVLLDIDLTTGKAEKKPLPVEDAAKFVGGRGLGMKILWDRLKRPGVDALSPENPLMFMPGPLSGFPIPSSCRTCVVAKSPRTTPVASEYPYASTVAYSNMGGFFGPEIRFAGYDGIVVTGRSSSPAYILIDDGKVEIRDAGKFWGMGTDEFDKRFIQELGDRRFRTCYIGPAGENLVSYACIINTAARAAGSRFVVQDGFMAFTFLRSLRRISRLQPRGRIRRVSARCRRLRLRLRRHCRSPASSSCLGRVLRPVDLPPRKPQHE